jgi:hypothetical protein
MARILIVADEPDIVLSLEEEVDRGPPRPGSALVVVAGRPDDA